MGMDDAKNVFADRAESKVDVQLTVLRNQLEALAGMIDRQAVDLSTVLSPEQDSDSSSDPGEPSKPSSALVETLESLNARLDYLTNSLRDLDRRIEL